MRQLLTILLSFNLVSGFSQSSNPLIISNDGNYLLLFKDGPSGFSSTYFLEVIDTDLGERIVQLRQEHPSHIVLPAIHLKREDVGELFHKHLDTPQGESDPARLTEYARHHLRELYKHSQATISGANFLVADTGTS